MLAFTRAELIMMDDSYQIPFFKPPSFSIYKPNSVEKVETLKHCFIKRMTLKTTALPSIIKGDDGFVYTAVYDSRLPLLSEVEVIVSFQAHTYGYFAVIRAARNIRRME